MENNVGWQNSPERSYFENNNSHRISPVTVPLPLEVPGNLLVISQKMDVQCLGSLPINNTTYRKTIHGKITDYCGIVGNVQYHIKDILITHYTYYSVPIGIRASPRVP
jgi:hypothetical protein